MIHVFAFAAMMAVCFAFAFIAGGRPERVAMSAQLVAFALSLLAMSFTWSRWQELPVALAVIDVTLALGLTALALKANRLWPILLAGMQIAAVFAHLAMTLSFPLPTAGYAIFVQLWGWPMLIVSAGGTYCHKRRVAKHGEEQDWKPLWPHQKFTAF